jgi:predicted MPP superfamily phosphohydrolase
MMQAGWYAYLGLRLITPLGLGTGLSLALWGLLALPFALVIWIPLMIWRRGRGGAHAGGALARGYLCAAYLSVLFFLVVARDVVALLAWGVARLGGQSAPPLQGPGWTLLLIALAFLGLRRGRANAVGVPRVREVKVPIADLPTELDGFRLVQISDVHVGRSIRRDFVAGVVKRVNELSADLVAITGDLGDGLVAELRDDLAPLGELSAKDGVCYVTGNHEYYWDATSWVDAVRGLGIRPLLNAHQVVERGAQRMVVAGVPDLWARRLDAHPDPDPIAALEGAPDAPVRILLAHQPRVAHLKGAERFQLMICGHTHGGQFIPWTLVIHLFQPFVRGLHRHQGRWIYTNTGTGYWGPPTRLGSPAEITLLTLARE